MIEFTDGGRAKLAAMPDFERFTETRDFAARTGEDFSSYSARFAIPGIFRAAYDELRQQYAEQRYLAEHPPKTEIQLLEEQAAAAMRVED